MGETLRQGQTIGTEQARTSPYEIRAHHMSWYIVMMQAKSAYPHLSDAFLAATTARTMVENDQEIPSHAADIFGADLSGVSQVQAYWTDKMMEYLMLGVKDEVKVTEGEGEICRGCVIGAHCKVRYGRHMMSNDNVAGALTTLALEALGHQATPGEENGDRFVVTTAGQLNDLIQRWPSTGFGYPPDTDYIRQGFLHNLGVQ